jgi:hypothetical protein
MNLLLTLFKENIMMSWEEMSPLEQAQCTYWDMYKDAYGVRPRGIDTSAWTLEQFDSEFKVLGEVIEREEYARKVDEAINAVEFEKRVGDLIASGAQNRDTAMRWIHDAEGSQGDDDYLCYLLGLRYGYFRKAA